MITQNTKREMLSIPCDILKHLTGLHLMWAYLPRNQVFFEKKGECGYGFGQDGGFATARSSQQQQRNISTSSFHIVTDLLGGNRTNEDESQNEHLTVS